MNKKVDYIAGIDTLEITSTTFTEQAFDFFTHDTSRIVQRDVLAEPKYKYRTNPDKTLYDTSTIDGYKAALSHIMEVSKLQNSVKTRIDFRFDDYCNPYEDLYKINKLLLLLVAERYDIKNKYQSIDLESAKLKTLRIQNKYLEMECYNKAEEENGSLIKCRLELRAKALYDDEDEQNKERRELENWLKRLEQVTDRKQGTFTALIDRLNSHLMERYKEHTDRGQINSTSEFITKYADFIFTTPQLVDLYSRLGYNNPKVSASKYKRTHKIEFYSLKELRNYVNQIRRAAMKFLEE